MTTPLHRSVNEQNPPLPSKCGITSLAAKITVFLVSSLFSFLLHASIPSSTDTSVTNKVVTQYHSGKLVVTKIGNDSDNRLVLSLVGDNTLRIQDTNNDVVASIGSVQKNTSTVDVPLDTIEAGLVINGAGGNDLLTIDMSQGNPIPPGGLTYYGGSQPDGGEGDALAVIGGTANLVTHKLVNASDGSIILHNAEGISRIDYIGLEPIIDDTVTADRVFDFTGATETITISDEIGVPGRSFIDSTLSEIVFFANPTNSLTITTTNGAGDDIVQLVGLDAAFDADLTINMDNSDMININGPIDIGSGDLSFESNTITMANNISTTSSVTLKAFDDVIVNSGNITATGAANIAITADFDNDANGAGGEIRISPGSTLNSGSGTITLFADETVTAGALKSTSTSANAIDIDSVNGSAMMQSGSSSSTTSGGVSVMAKQGINFLFNGLNMTTGTGILDLDTEGNITITNAGIQANGAVDIDAMGNVVVSQGGLNASTGSGIIDINAGGTLQTSDASIASNGNATLHSSLDMNITNGGLLTGSGDIMITTDAQFLQDNGGLIMSSGNISIISQGDMFLRSDPVSAGMDLVLQGADLLITDSGVRATGTIDVDSDNLTVSGGGISSAGNVDIASKVVSIQDGGVASTEALIKIVAENTTIEDTGVVGETEVDIDVTGTLTTKIGRIFSNGKVKLKATGNLTLSNVESNSNAVDAITITSTTGAIIDEGDVASDLSAPNGGIVAIAETGYGQPAMTDAQDNALESTSTSLSIDAGGLIDAYSTSNLSALSLHANEDVTLIVDGLLTDSDTAVDVSGINGILSSDGQFGASGQAILMDLDTVDFSDVVSTDPLYFAESNSVNVIGLTGNSLNIVLEKGLFNFSTASLTHAILLDGGFLGGTTVLTEPVTSTNASGGIKPGLSPGILTFSHTGDQTQLEATDTVTMELLNNTPGTGHDQLVFTLSDNQLDLGDASLQVTNLPGYTHTVGETFTLVRFLQNAGAFSGTFKDLPEGAEVESNAGAYTISYTGGPFGNDIVLSSTPFSSEVCLPIKTTSGPVAIICI